tara:strand:- start:543 stop:1025 length:483 start_codon:yes stop_codon:yes gene_type:complete
MMQEHTVSVKKYILICVGIFLLLSLVGLNSNKVPYLIQFILLLTTTYFIGKKFGRDHRRLPLSRERHWFAFGNMLFQILFIGVSLAMVVLFLNGMGESGKFEGILNLVDRFESGFRWPLLFAVIISMVLEYMMFYFAFGWGAKKQLKKLQKIAGESNIQI